MVVKVAVIGAGVTGLSVATVLKEKFPNLPITLFADKFSPGTTSDGAGIEYSLFINKSFYNIRLHFCFCLHYCITLLYSIISWTLDAFLVGRHS
jgi:L-2-hydroxyglutarate oxidase LhgO